MRLHSPTETARLLPMRALIRDLETVLAEYGRGEIVSPERLVVPCGEGDAGFLLSMPCTAPDLVAHKLITVYGGNPAAGLPAIQGQVTCLDAATGTPLFALDGPTVTGRRTAAISMIGLTRLSPRPPETLLLIGTGAQARAHAEAALDLFPSLRIAVRSRHAETAEAFCRSLPGAEGRVAPERAGAGPYDAVVAVTGSRVPVYDEPARAGTLVIGAGAYRLDMVEIGARTLEGAQIYVDDPIGAPGEAGDLVAADVDWQAVRPLALSITTAPDPARPVFLKSVGCAAWDLAACRTARAHIAA